MIISNGKDIRLFLTDCDGCLTDGGMYYSEKGDELKKFNTRDGMGFSILRKLGIRTGIITGENVEQQYKKNMFETCRANVFARIRAEQVEEASNVVERIRTDGMERFTIERAE